MRRNKVTMRTWLMLAVLALLGFRGAALGQDDAAKDSKLPENSDSLLISTRRLPPNTYPFAQYQYSFEAEGNFVAPLVWRVEKGSLPPGLKLENDGFLHGEAQQPGEYQFTVAVRDSGKPQQAVQQKFTIIVEQAFTVAWKVPAHVAGSRIEGSIEVSNTTHDTIDLTFIVEAIADNGRATAIGYQHFPLPSNATNMELPFGDNLPHGAYKVNVDVIGEDLHTRAIYRQRMEAPKPLNIAVGP